MTATSGSPELYEVLSGLQETEPGSVWRVKELPGGKYVEVACQIYNWRVCRTDGTDWGYDRGWCFYGTGFGTFVNAVLAAMVWDGADDSAPPGWDKNAFTGEYSRRRSHDGNETAD